MLNIILRALKELYTPFRRSGRAEWLFMLLASGIIPLVGVPATMRRLRDMNQSPLWTLPFLALPVMVLMTVIPIRFLGQDAEKWKVTMAIPTLMALAITLGLFVWMCAKGSAPANVWGQPAEKGTTTR